VKQGGAAVLREGCDIVTGETFVPVSLNVNNLGEAAVLHLPLLWPGLCQSRPTDKHLRKTVELHLAWLCLVLVGFSESALHSYK
jgi:hypothetical protein